MRERRIRGLGTTMVGLLALLAAFASAAGDETAPPGRALSDLEIEKLRELHYQEQEEVRLVLLPGVVTNRRGRVMQGLGPDDFTVYEDYVPQEIKYFGTEANQPISIAFLLDVSGSMRQLGKLDEAKEAIRVFVKSFSEGDRFGLICFADDQVAWVTEFTSDPGRFLLRLDVQEAYGQTAIFDRSGQLYCPVCGNNSNVHPIQTSYAFKLLRDELLSLGVAMRLQLEDLR